MNEKRLREIEAIILGGMTTSEEEVILMAEYDNLVADAIRGIMTDRETVKRKVERKN